MSDRLVRRLRAAGCVFAVEEAALLRAQCSDPGELEELVARRVSGQPLEHVLGWVEFCGLRLAVDPGVFVPRQRTVFLVQEAVALAQRAAGRCELPRDVGVTPRPVVVDLCCGTGAIGAVMATRLPDLDLVAADLDPAAVANARRNLEPKGGRVYQGDLYAALPAGLRGRVDVLIANAPYVPTRDLTVLPPEARDYEAAIALDGGQDGLEVHRRVAAGAADWLSPTGSLLIEIGQPQTPQAMVLMARAGLDPCVRHSADLQATVVIGGRRDESPPLPARR